MAGLRERQKLARQRRLLQAAAAHFQEKGFERARVEEIAASAELSAGTLYNYYRHKGELLIAVVALELEEMLAACETLAADPPARAETAINALVERHLDHALARLSRDSWRHALAKVIAQPETPLARRYGELEARTADQVRRLLDSLQQRGAVRPDLDTIAFGRMIFNNAQALFVEAVKEEGLGIEPLKAGLRAQHAALCRLIA